MGTDSSELESGTLRDRLLPLRERLLANLILIAQIPAPSGVEQRRVEFVLDRFGEQRLGEAGSDEAGNAVGRLSGQVGERTILLVSHLDTFFASNDEHEVIVEADRIIGTGIEDNAVGAAVVSMIPTILDTLGIKLQSDLLLLGSTRSLGRGSHAGVRFFLDHPPSPIQFGICVEGIRLGRINYFSIGTARGDIICNVRPQLEPSRSYGSESALIVLNHIINRILGIAIPSRPFTDIKIGKMSAGVTYDIEPNHAELGLEVVSHSDEMLERVCREIGDIVGEMSARHEVEAKLDFFTGTRAGGLSFGHPLVRGTLKVMRELGIGPDQGHSPSELSELICRNIPAVTLGMTTGKKSAKYEPGCVFIDPLFLGIAQLIGVIAAIDRGECDES